MASLRAKPVSTLCNVPLLNVSYWNFPNSALRIAHVVIHMYLVYCASVIVTLNFLSSLQLLESVSKKPASADETFSKKSVVEKKNRYKDRFPCMLERIKSHFVAMETKMF